MRWHQTSTPEPKAHAAGRWSCPSTSTSWISSGAAGISDSRREWLLFGRPGCPMPGLSFHGTTAVSPCLVRSIPTGQVQVFICPYFGPISVLSGPSCPLQFSSSTLGFTFPTKLNSPASRSAAELRAKAAVKVTTGRLRVDSTKAAVEFSRLLDLPHRHISHSPPTSIPMLSIAPGSRGAWNLRTTVSCTVLPSPPGWG